MPLITYKSRMEKIFSLNQNPTIKVVFLASMAVYIAVFMFGVSPMSLFVFTLAGIAVFAALVNPFIGLCILSLSIFKLDIPGSLTKYALSSEIMLFLSRYSLFLGLIIVFGLIAQKILRRARILPKNDYILPLGIVFFIIMIISGINSGLNSRNIELFRVFIQVLALYFLINVVIDSPRRLKQFTWFIIAFGTFLSVILLLKYFSAEETIFPGGTRSTYIAMGLSLGLLITTKSRALKYLFMSLFLINLYVVILCAQRRPLVMLIVILIGYLMKRKISFRSFLLVAGATYIMSLIMPVIPEQTITRYAEVFQSDFTGSGRTFIWASALEVIKYNTLIGIGPGNLVPTIYRGAHNLYLGTLAEVGIFGFIVLILIINVAIFHFIKCRSNIKKCEDSLLLNLADAWEMSFYGWLAVSFFTATLPVSYVLWEMIGISMALKTITSHYKKATKK